MESRKDYSEIKILISYSEFDRLKKIEQQFLELEKQNLKKSLANDQEGSGQVDASSHLFKIASLVAQKVLQATKEPIPSSSNYPTNIWQSSELMPPVAEAQDDVSKPEVLFSAPIKKDDLNDEFDEKQLIGLVPKSKRRDAMLLLEEFDNRGNELTWNSSGTVFIDQTAIPQSNIFVLFPLLFKTNRPKEFKGLNEMLNKINEMGLSDLIANRKVSSKKVQSNMNNDPETNTPWWYIGD